MPIEAISRVSSDNLVSASALNSSIPKNVSNALASAMALSPEKRTETVSMLISQLSEIMDFGQTADEPEVNANEEAPKKKMKASTRYALIAAGISLGVLVVIFIILMLVLFPSDNKDKPSSSAPITSSDMASSDAESELASSDVHYLYSVPNFVTKNIEPVLNDKDYTDKFKLTVEYEYNEEYAEQIVFEQSVEQGTPISENGTEIILKVSRGSKYRTLPDLVGKNIDYAKDTLYEKFIRYEVETEIGNYGDPKKVSAMSIEPGTIIDISQVHSVTLYVYEELPEIENISSEVDSSWVEDLE